MDGDPCNVCGGTDLNLVDGYYYCTECGTQDANVRETVVDHTYADGTFTYLASKKFSTVIRDGVEMSSEWHKWHAYNFVLVGLADELIALGAKPSFKMKLLWVWTRYIKKYQVKDDEPTGELSDITKNDKPAKKLQSNNESNYKFSSISIQHMTKNVLVSILYVALNLDKSDIQLSHLIRFINEKRISLRDCPKFVPKELNTKVIPHWTGFIQYLRHIKRTHVRAKALSFFKILKLGSAIIPDIKQMIERFIKELCLPDDFKNLVFSIMNLVPYNLEAGEDSNHFIRLPDYELVAMSYILVALKMCFGLDCDYEVRLSDAVDKINEEEGYMQSHRLGLFPEPTDRLFSFREWCNYLQFRKTILSKYSLTIAQQHGLPFDDYAVIESLQPTHTENKLLRHEVTMDILNKIPVKNDVFVIPKSEFPATLTPMSTYTDVICQHTKDPELKLLLSEDFTQYSLKYACKFLKLPTADTLTGVNMSNKVINSHIIGTFGLEQRFSASTVLVRNCENKNWLKTKPPTLNHITKVKENSDGIDSDSVHAYYKGFITRCLLRNTEINSNRDLSNNNIDTDKKLETLEEETGKNIFDDEFADVDFNETKVCNNITQTVFDHFDNENFNNSVINNEDVNDSKIGILDSKSDDDASTLILLRYNPDTFNRDSTIKELVLAKCKKYKIPVPTEYKPENTRKRKTNVINNEAGNSEVKRKKRNPRASAKKEIDRLISMYYENLENDVLKKISDHVKTIVRTTEDKAVNDVTHNESYNEDFCHSTVTNCRDGDLDIEDMDIQHINQDDISNANNIQNNLEPTLSDSDSDREHDEYINEIIPQVDPKFDEKTHDVNQLYLRVENDEDEDVSDVDNPTINEILDKHINKDKSAVNTNLDENISTDEDDIPFSVLLEDKKIVENRNNDELEELESLIEDRDNIKEFNYWIRRYAMSSFTCQDDMAGQFGPELKKHFPKSFNILLTECSVMLHCTPFTLYKCMVYIENTLFSRI